MVRPAARIAVSDLHPNRVLVHGCTSEVKIYSVRVSGEFESFDVAGIIAGGNRAGIFAAVLARNGKRAESQKK